MWNCVAHHPAPITPILALAMTRPSRYRKIQMEPTQALEPQKVCGLRKPPLCRSAALTKNYTCTWELSFTI